MTMAILTIKTAMLQLLAMESVVILWRETHVGDSSFVKVGEEYQSLTDDAGIAALTLPVCALNERYQVRIRQAGDIVYAARFYLVEDAALHVIQNNPVFKDPHIISVTSDKVLVSDEKGKPAASSITTDELEKLQGIDVNIAHKFSEMDSILSGMGDDMDDMDSVLSGMDSAIRAMDSAFIQLNEDIEQLNAFSDGVDSVLSAMNDTLEGFDIRLDNLAAGQADKQAVAEYSQFKNWVFPSNLGLEKHYTDINIQYFPQKLILQNSLNDTVGGVFLQYKHSYDVGHDTFYCYFNENAVHIFSSNSGVFVFSDYSGLSLSQVDTLWHNRHTLSYAFNNSFNQFLMANNPVLALAERCDVWQVKLSKLGDNQAQFDSFGAIYVPTQTNELFKGTHPSLDVLKAAFPVGQSGWSAHVDPIGKTASLALWDVTENDWVISGTVSIVVSKDLGNAATNGTDGGVFVSLQNYVQKDGTKVLSDFNFDAASKAKVDGLGNYYTMPPTWYWPTDGTFAQFLAQYVKNTYANGVKHHFVILDGYTFNEQFVIDSVDLRNMVIRTQTYSTVCNVDCSNFGYVLSNVVTDFGSMVSYRSFITIQNCIGGQIYGKFQDANPSAPNNVVSGKNVHAMRINSPGILLNNGNDYLSLTGFKMQSWIENYSGNFSGNSLVISGCTDLHIINPKNNPWFNVVGNTSYNATHAITVKGGAATLTLGSNVAFSVDSDTAVSIYQGSNLQQSVSITAKGELVLGTLTYGFTLSSASRLTLLKIGSGEYNQFNENTIPAANKMPSVEIWHTDFNVKMRSNGSYWIPLSAFICAAEEPLIDGATATTNTKFYSKIIPFKYVGDKGQVEIFWNINGTGSISNTKTVSLSVSATDAIGDTIATRQCNSSLNIASSNHKVITSIAFNKHKTAAVFSTVLGTTASSAPTNLTYDNRTMNYLVFSYYLSAAALSAGEKVTLDSYSVKITPGFSGA